MRVGHADSPEREENNSPCNIGTKLSTITYLLSPSIVNLSTLTPHPILKLFYFRIVQTQGRETSKNLSWLMETADYMPQSVAVHHTT
jgi:hypothetical protein